MELLDFEWTRCLDGYRLNKREPLSDKVKVEFDPGGLGSLGNVLNPDPDNISPNSGRLERYRPLKIALFKTFATWEATPEGMVRFCDCYGHLLGPPERQRIVPVQWMLDEQKTLSITLMLLESGDPAELMKRLHSWAAGCTFGLRRADDGSLAPTLTPGSLIQAIWLQLALYAASGAKLLSCDRCGKPFQVGAGTKRRSTAKYCSNACKVAAYKARQEA
jgi:hypothetical protein